MRGAIPPLPQYVFMSWCLVKHFYYTTKTWERYKKQFVIRQVMSFLFRITVINKEAKSVPSQINGLLRRVFGPKREEVAGGSRTLHRAFKSKRVRLAEHVERVEDMKKA
jgi:hypothetical protein